MSWLKKSARDLEEPIFGGFATLKKHQRAIALKGHVLCSPMFIYVDMLIYVHLCSTTYYVFLAWSSSSAFYFDVVVPSAFRVQCASWILGRATRDPRSLSCKWITSFSIHNLKRWPGRDTDILAAAAAMRRPATWSKSSHKRSQLWGSSPLNSPTKLGWFWMI